MIKDKAEAKYMQVYICSNMHIPLEMFEQFIPEPVLKKGLDYFLKGKVTDVQELSPGEFESTVNGQSSYRVKLTVRQGSVVKAQCNCPYTDGVLCKHITALIFHLQQDMLDLKPAQKKTRDDTGTQRKPRKQQGDMKPKKTAVEKAMESIAQICEKVSKDELVRFITDIALVDDGFAKSFQHAFADKRQDETVKQYAADMKSLLKSAIGRNSYDSWRRAPQAGRAAMTFLALAGTHLEKGNLRTAAMMAFGGLEALTNALQYIDDSNADIGDNIRESLEILYRIVAAEPGDEVRKLMFEYCLSAYKKKTFEDWDWHLDMIKIAAKLTDDKTSANALVKLVEVEPVSTYSHDRLAELVHDLYRKSGQPDKADAYRLSHMDTVPMRSISVRYAMEKSDYAEAIRLLKEGYAQDIARKPGLACHWQEELLRVYDMIGQHEESANLARKLFMGDSSFNASHYAMIKNRTASLLWAPLLQELVNELSQKDPRDLSGKRQGIFVQESMWQELMLLVTPEPSMWKVERYDEYLGERFPEAWDTFITRSISQEAQEANSRSAYERLYRHLVMLIKRGKDELAQRLLRDLRQQYKHRPAMMALLRGL